eukprot:7192747-Alexandrium_andersonii.AAC.1
MNCLLRCFVRSFAVARKAFLRLLSRQSCGLSLARSSFDCLLDQFGRSSLGPFLGRVRGQH